MGPKLFWTHWLWLNGQNQLRQPSEYLICSTEEITIKKMTEFHYFLKQSCKSVVHCYHLIPNCKVSSEFITTVLVIMSSEV